MKNKTAFSTVAFLATACLVSAAFAAPVARVYVTRVWSQSNKGILSYLVDENGAWTLEKCFIAADSTPLSARPTACVKLGKFYYILDQYNDPSQYFSIHKYDRHGAYRGTLVNRYTSTLNVDAQNQRDNVQLMAASRDGRYFYIPTWQANNGALILRVTVADGTVEEFRTSEIGEGAAVCVGPDETVYVAARNKGKVFAFSPNDLTRSIRSYAQTWPTGVFYDDATDRLYIGTHWNAGGQFTSYKVDGTDKQTWTNPLVFRPGTMVRIGSKIYIGSWSASANGVTSTGDIVEVDPSDGSMSVVVSGLGCINDLFLELLPVAEPIASPAAHTSLVVKDGVCYFAADNAAAAESGTALSTVWKSADNGATWETFASYEAANPSLFVRGNDISIFFEPRRAAADRQHFSVGDIGADGSFTHNFTVTNNLSELLTPANGAISSARWGFAGARTGIGFSTPTARTSAAMTFITSKTAIAYPDAVITSIRTNTLTAAMARSPFADVLPAMLASGPENGYDDYYQELVPVVQRHSDKATREGPEYVLKTAHLNPSKITDFSPKWAPYPTEYVMMPGGSKEFDFFYDATSRLYWAVTIPVTNAAMLVEHEQTEVRNVVALYASPDLRRWQLCRIIRAEGTPDTVAFARPNAAVLGNDLLVTYSTAGTANAGQTTIGGREFACARVADFRATWPGVVDPDEWFVVPEFGINQLKRFSRNPATGEWMGETIVTNGVYGGKTYVYPSAAVVHGDRIYVTCETQGVFVFDIKGRFVRVYPLPANTKCDTLAVSQDGTYLLVTDSSWIDNSNAHHSIRKVDIATGTWTTLVSKANDSSFASPRGICIKSDGSFFVASRDNGFVRHYAADGSSYTTVSTMRGVQAVKLDADESHFFIGSRWGEVNKINLSDNSSVVLTAALTDVESGAYSFAQKDGLLWIPDYGAGLIYTLDPDTPYQTPKPVMAGFNLPGRGVFVFRRRATMLILR